MEPQAHLIDLVRLKSPHTGENIHHTTECVLDHFNLKEKVYRVVTDNASTLFSISAKDVCSLPECNQDLVAPAPYHMPL